MKKTDWIIIAALSLLALGVAAEKITQPLPAVPVPMKATDHDGEHSFNGTLEFNDPKDKP